MQYNPITMVTPTREKAYSLAAGVALASRLAEEGRYVFTTQDARHVAREIQISGSGVGMMLTRLTDAGWIVRLRRGLYAGTGRMPGGVDVHPFAIATAVVQPSAISLWSALAHHGMTTQVPQFVSATTPKRVSTPSMRKGAQGTKTRSRSGRHRWTVGDVDIEFLQIRRDRFFGFDEVWIDRLFRVPIMDRERTIIDLVAYPRLFGGLDTALATIDEQVASLDIDRLADYAIRYDSKIVAARIGWCLEQVGAVGTSLDRLAIHVGPGQQVLDPTRPARGRRTARWSVLDNVSPGR